MEKNFLGLVCVVLGLVAFGHHVIKWVCEGIWVLPSWTLLLVEADGQRHEGWGNHGEETENRRRENIYISLELSMFGLIRIQQAPYLMSHIMFRSGRNSQKISY